MPSTSYRKFEQRLALVAWYRYIFGVGDPSDPASVRRYHEELSRLREGYDVEGRSYVYNYLAGRMRGIGETEMLRWDQNIRRHTDALNRQRAEPITLKYFQVLAALKTEHYLDRISSDVDAFLSELNSYVEERNRRDSGRIGFPHFERHDVNKVAYWMATGSGKTLLLHLNYHQYLHYRRRTGNPLDHILLVTPNAGLSDQHIAEMRKSGISCGHFSDMVGGLFEHQPDAVKVIEITKLVEEKTGEGKSVEVSAFEGRNLVFVDEGHKGSGSEAGAWRTRRAELAEGGFTFEYSATFGQAVSGSGTSAEVEEEYGRAIIVDYSYPRFYEDGYGKDYRILNLESDLDVDLRRTYLMANLLTLYEQSRVYAESEREFNDEYNLTPPLMLFIGHSVTAGKTRSTLSGTDKQTLSDVQELVDFIRDVLANEGDWVPSTIEAILAGHAGLEGSDGQDLFADAFPALRMARSNGAELYAGLLERLFHVDTAGMLHLVNLKSSEGEIGLRAGGSDRFFGVINIGDDRNFLDRIERDQPDIVVEESSQQASLFRAINTHDSSINLLVGAKKFIEGWSSWRVSTMGLMNIGRGEGPQIIQLFGRGVRLLGKGRSLKRSSELEGAGPHPPHVRLLETLNIFGVRAKYMAQFRDYLSDEGIDPDSREVVTIKTRVQQDFFDQDLVTIRLAAPEPFEEAVRLRLTADEGIVPAIDLTPKLEALVSADDGSPHAGGKSTPEQQRVSQTLLKLVDWNRIHREVWQYREARGYRNLTVDREVLREVLTRGLYRLVCPPDLLACRRYADLTRIEALVLMILRSYVTAFFASHKRGWEQRGLVYVPLEESDGNVVRIIEARVTRTANDLVASLKAARDMAALYDGEDGLPPRVHFDRHLYLPLLVSEAHREAEVRYSPPALNSGEAAFVRALRGFLAGPDGERFMERREVYLLRNQSRGRGVGFAAGDDLFFPDFLLWVKSDGLQHIVFIDPKGLLTASGPAHPKVRFCETITEYQDALNDRSARDDLRLHSFIISQTPVEELRPGWGLHSVDDFNRLNVYFPDQDRYVERLLATVVDR